ncbi:MAG: methylated-DNA--[protein]-cysteine S-methyltransferase [Myxococcota bacterium]
MKEVLCTSRFDSPIGVLRIVSSHKGLVYIELPVANGRGFEGWRSIHAKDAEVVERRTAHEDVIDQLLDFLSGNRRDFAVGLDLRATEFQLSVYKTVSEIGYGETCSYSEVAQAIDKPRAVRAVGAANGANPIPLIIPCHRVIAQGGALQGYAGGLDMKAKLLAMESPLLAAAFSQARPF